MNRNGLLARAGIGAAGAMLLTAVAGAAIADEVDQDNVDINVEIAEVPPVGALTMSVAADSTTLTEVDSGDPDIRQFNGTLPTVTVSDDREEVPEDVFWYVTGQSSAFSSDDAGATDLPAGHLGWTPEVTDEDGTGAVAAGDEVLTVLDEGPNAVGLVAEELLALSLDSQEASVQGEWEASADLFLKTPVDVAPGSYEATLTLTLWEDEL
ncbi:hypothetical protein [Georgenia faecalis]|uniref:WxL domain-containing protein n=1 Tax=Georgenia faecalis TaxID=2483799 RepID=A0ABV9DAH3_9MICO|nr:hypothetical protein [Georgenia faecalis]